MSEIRRAIRTIHERELAGLAVGTEAAQMRPWTSVSLIAASKVLDKLGVSSHPGHPSGKVDLEVDLETGYRLSVSTTSRFRMTEVTIPEGFEDAEASGRTIALSERRSKTYRSYPFNIRGVLPVLELHDVTMLEESVTPTDDRIAISGSNKLGVHESHNTPEEILTFSRNLELIAKAGGFYDELAARNQDLFSHQAILESLTD